MASCSLKTSTSVACGPSPKAGSEQSPGGRWGPAWRRVACPSVACRGGEDTPDGGEGRTPGTLRGGGGCGARGGAVRLPLARPCPGDPGGPTRAPHLVFLAPVDQDVSEPPQFRSPRVSPPPPRLSVRLPQRLHSGSPRVPRARGRRGPAPQDAPPSSSAPLTPSPSFPLVPSGRPAAGGTETPRPPHRLLSCPSLSPRRGSLPRAGGLRVPSHPAFLPLWI
ncbi:SH3 domain-containing protein C23A1.17-like [Choloepus didactylus]|uniref:SH3 domain-containing protein C23A1.17-like n=1 Tax=Choloepus didactylus TaxID=27675 RepID=UPI00189F3A37|nr:SH3 domain-containing protein C23A1.17-like [Choloepus didactylus]